MHILTKIESIEEGRNKIASIDAEIAELISERTNIAEMIGTIKKELSLPVKNPDAEKKVLERFGILADNLGLPKEKMDSIAMLLIEIAIDREDKIQKNRGI